MTTDNPLAEILADDTINLDEVSGEIWKMALALQAEGPDEYPLGYYLHLAGGLYRDGVRVEKA